MRLSRHLRIRAIGLSMVIVLAQAVTAIWWIRPASAYLVFSNVPLQVAGISGATAVAVGYNFCLALKSDGSVWAWGRNDQGQLGNGTFTTTAPYGIATPGQVSGLSNVTAVSAAGNGAIALKSDGTVWSWGHQILGDGTFNTSSVPVQVSGLSGVVSIGEGVDASFALKSDKSLWGWGYNSWGELGIGSLSVALTPVQYGVAKLASVATGGGGHSVAVRTNGGIIRSCGLNNAGQLGDGTTNNTTTPTAVSGLAATMVAAGNSHSMAIDSTNALWAWGDNTFGQLGNGTTTNSSVPILVSGLGSVVGVAGGQYHTVALLSNGTVKAWGINSSGQLGNGTITDQHSPVSVSGLSSVLGIAAGFVNSAAVKSDGTVWAWGDGQYGQLGQ